MNSITSSKTQIVLDYYSLPVCKPDKIFQLKQNIGNVLSGEEYSNTKYSFRMMEDQTQPQLLCKMKLTEDDISLLKTRIEEEYNVQWSYPFSNLIIGSSMISQPLVWCPWMMMVPIIGLKIHIQLDILTELLMSITTTFWQFLQVICSLHLQFRTTRVQMERTES